MCFVWAGYSRAILPNFPVESTDSSFSSHKNNSLQSARNGNKNPESMMVFIQKKIEAMLEGPAATRSVSPSHPSLYQVCIRTQLTSNIHIITICCVSLLSAWPDRCYQSNITNMYYESMYINRQITHSIHSKRICVIISSDAERKWRRQVPLLYFTHS